jgi:hypothetical protein
MYNLNMSQPYLTPEQGSAQTSLKDCPFCGTGRTDFKIHLEWRDSESGKAFWVGCEECGAQTSEQLVWETVVGNWNSRV